MFHGNDDAARRLDETNKGIIFKNCAPFTDCISKINNAQNRSCKIYRCCNANV